MTFSSLWQSPSAASSQQPQGPSDNCCNSDQQVRRLKGSWQPGAFHSLTWPFYEILCQSRSHALEAGRCPGRAMLHQCSIDPCKTAEQGCLPFTSNTKAINQQRGSHVITLIKQACASHSRAGCPLRRTEHLHVQSRAPSLPADQGNCQQVPFGARLPDYISCSTTPTKTCHPFAAGGHHAVVSSAPFAEQDCRAVSVPAWHLVFTQHLIVCRYPQVHQQGYNTGYPNASDSQGFPAQGTPFSPQQQQQGYPQNATQGMQQPTYGAHYFPAQQQYGAQAGMQPQGQQQPQFGAQQQYPGAQPGGIPGSFPQGQQGFQQGFPQGQQGFQQSYPGETPCTPGASPMAFSLQVALVPAVVLSWDRLQTRVMGTRCTCLSALQVPCSRAARATVGVRRGACRAQQAWLPSWGLCPSRSRSFSSGRA